MSMSVKSSSSDSSKRRHRKPLTLLVVMGLMSLMLAGPALASGFRNNLSIDAVGWGLAQPNLTYERRVSNLFSLGADFGFDALNIDDGVVLTPQARLYPIGALREGMVLQLGARLPAETDILGEAGLGYAFWVDRMHLTPLGKIRHDGSWQVKLELGYGWY